MTRNSPERGQDAECIPQATNQFKAGSEATEVTTEDRAHFDHQRGDKQRQQGNFTENFPPAGENREEAEKLLSIARTEFTCFISSSLLELEELEKLSDKDLELCDQRMRKLNRNLSWQFVQLKNMLDDPIELEELKALRSDFYRLSDLALVKLLTEKDKRNFQGSQSFGEDDDWEEQEEELSHTQTRAHEANFQHGTGESERQDVKEQVMSSCQESEGESEAHERESCDREANGGMVRRTSSVVSYTFPEQEEDTAKSRNRHCEAEENQTEQDARHQEAPTREEVKSGI